MKCNPVFSKKIREKRYLRWRGGMALAGIRTALPGGRFDDAAAWCESMARRRGVAGSGPDLGPDPVSSQVWAFFINRGGCQNRHG
jgi:hypothetical protein